MGHVKNVLYCNKLGRTCIDINSLNPKRANPYWIRKHGSKKKQSRFFQRSSLKEPIKLQIIVSIFWHCIR